MILLDEDKYNEDKKENKKSDKNKEKIINNDIILKKYDDEIDYVNSLIDYTKNKLSLFNPNINNNINILEKKKNLNFLNKNNNNNSNNIINENLNFISEKHEQNINVDPINIFDPNYIIQLLESGPELNTNKNINYNNKNHLFQIDNKSPKKDKKDSFSQEKKEDLNFFLNEGLINFLNNGNNQNEIDLELNENNNLRRESFMSNFDNPFNINYDKDNLFE